MDDPIRGFEGAHPIRRSEVIARMWAAQEGIIEEARRIADGLDEAAPWPDNADARYAAERLERAYREQDLEAWWEALRDFLGKLADLKEAGVLK